MKARALELVHSQAAPGAELVTVLRVQAATFRAQGTAMDCLADAIEAQGADVPTAGAPQLLLTKHELARALQCSPSTLDRLRKEGMPVVMLGESPRFEAAAVTDWLRVRGSHS